MTTSTLTKEDVLEALHDVFDPEIPVNIYELGLIYDIIVDVNGLAVIKMTLTAPNCPTSYSTCCNGPQNIICAPSAR